ncbi:GNAT family N-acetyltransferase [Temperatibacter marinus]|uniref:GNAT family N-acetyltransferase n=1 Tax=Temperatibacter marinus TaxID=1456591 RepID=A0AA52H9F0_9PROT|nr:GNAT family N-acetyltransferase [Temperatibacter marinus]WND03126.1 GNAT family N-acetyltransferase [Temperatibacter marinus]
MAPIKSLHKNESALIGSIIGESFTGDPVNSWIFGDETDTLQAFYALLAKKLYLRKGFGHITQCHSAGTLWLSPHVRKHIPIYRSLDIAWLMATRSGITSLQRGMSIDHTLDLKRPLVPHYYLFAIGTLPNSQGKGLGGMLMEAGLERADRERMPAYLESSKESNIPFYRHFGFEIVEEVKATPEAPSLWLMWREAS